MGLTINVDSLRENLIYDVIRYPGGELQVRLNDRGQYVTDAAQRNPQTKVDLFARIRSSDDFMILAQMCDILDHHGFKEITLYLPYLPYGRADRRFVGDGDTLGLRVFASLLKSLQIEYPAIQSIFTIDMHPSREKMNDALNQCQIPVKINNVVPVGAIIRSIHDTLAHYNIFFRDAIIDSHKANTVNLLFPDKGAAERYGSILPNVLESNVGRIHLNKLFCGKVRNSETGVFMGFNVPAEHEFEPGPVLIIDDICDGGGTFNGIVETMEKNNIHERMYLYVTHGIFSQGFDRLRRNFEQIFTTDTIYSKTNNSGSLVNVYSVTW